MSPVALSTEKVHSESNGRMPLKSSPSKAQPFKAKPISQPVQDPAPKPQQKPLSGRSSKPIITWFQRKLAGTGRTKRTENHRAVTETIALTKSRVGPNSSSSRTIPRVASSPVPSPTYGNNRHGRHESHGGAPQRRTISLNGDDQYSIEGHDDNSLEESSLARESTWSPASVQEADDDASLRPIPPSAPPSPSPSRSSSSYLSDPRTFRSIAASTKPTTLLSIDMNGNGMAHIAQAPTTPSTYANRFPHIRNSSVSNAGVHGSGASITFSPLPQSASRPSSFTNSGTHLAIQGHATLQAPLHTTHHPRNNPRPSSPPLDNASVLTLASSAYAIPGVRMNLGQSTTTSARGVGDSLSHFGGSITYGDVESTSQFVLGDDERLDERDVDASVRALRPRSTRRGSWESEASGWSARIQASAGTPSLTRERSQRTSNSIKTGVFTADNAEHERLDDIKDRDDCAVSIKPSSSKGENEITNGALSMTNADVSGCKTVIEAVEPVHIEEHKEHTQLIKFVSDTRTRLHEKDGSSGISPGHSADMA
ncbi:hypothetical protein C0993_004045 [Termitomyces sp. T159_Od127]|nr:hypothetical protein C0993_004045 [Termitomyces sp. T159_Od127]